MSFGDDSIMESYIRTQSAELPKLYEAFVMDQSPLDALAERIARIGRRESETAPVMMHADQAQDSAHLTSLVEKAIAAMDETLRRNEDKTATALESVAKWMERNDQARMQSARPVSHTNTHQDAALARTMSLLVDRLDELDSKISRQASPAANGMREMLVKIETRLDSLAKLNPMERNAHGVERSLKELDGRLSEISERLDPIQELPVNRAGVRQRTLRERSAPSQMIADITARQSDLDENLTNQKLHDLGARLDRQQIAEETRSVSAIDVQAFDVLRKDIAGLSEKINKASSASDDKTIRSLQNDLQHIASAVNGLAPKEQVSSIEAAIQSLATKIESTREDTIREAGNSAQASSANLERQFKTLISKLDEAHPTNDIALLAHNIECLQLKLDTLSETSLDSGLLQDLHHQTAQIGKHLTQAAAKPSGVEAIESRIADLAAQLERGAGGGSGLDNKTFLDLSSRIERIQSSIDEFSTPSVDIGHIEDMVQKLNTKIDTISERAMDMKGFETAIRTLEAKIDQTPKHSSQSVDLEGFEKAIRDLEAKLDKAPKHNAAPSVDLKGFEQAIRALEAKLDQMPQQGAIHAVDIPHPQITDALLNISAKLDAAQKLSSPSEKDFTRIIRSLENKIDAVQINTSPISTSQLDKMVNDLTKQMEKAQRPDASDKVLDALQEQIFRLSAKLDKNDDHLASLGSLEQTIGDIFSQLDSVKFASQDAAESAARNAVRDAMLEFKPHNAPENNDVKHLLNEFSSIKITQDEADRRTQNTLAAVHDTLEKIVDRLGMLEGEILSDRSKPEKMQSEASNTKAASHRPMLFAAPEEHDFPKSKDEPLAIKPASAEAFIPYTAPINNNHDFLGADAFTPSKPETPAPTPKPIFNFSSDIDPDLPLDPGISRPELPIEVAITPEARVQDAKSNFIAAARKAAQQAAEESAIALEQAKEQQEKNGLFNTAKQAIGGRVKSLAGYRKPILLGLAALVVASGGATVYKSMSQNMRTVDNTISKVKDEMTTGSNTQPANIQAKTPVEKQAETAVSVTPAQEPAATIKIAPQTAPAMTQPLPVAPAQNTKPPRVSDAKTSAPITADPIQVGTIPQRNLQTSGLSATGLPTPALPALARPVASNGQNIPSIQSNSQVKAVMAAQVAPVEELKTLAESGNARAQYELGSRYVDGLSVARDPKLATQWLEKAAAQGLAPAQYRLGSLYRDGKGLRNDSKLAHSWFKRSAEQGNARAMHNLAVVLAEGVTGAPDYSGAAEWFQKAAEYGIKDSQFNVAILFARGLGVSQDLVQSYKWFAVSAAIGDEDAARKRDEVGAKLSPEKLEEAKLLVQNYKPKALDIEANDIQTAPKNTPVAAANRQANSW